MIVSVSGFGWSGSGAVLDLLREYSDLEVAFDGWNVDPEFILLAEVDGIKDLDYQLTERPSRISSYLAIQRFRDLVKAYNKYMLVDQVFDGKLLKITEDYINKLVDFKFDGATYHEYYQTSPIMIKYNYLITRLLHNRLSRFFFKDAYKRFLYEKVTEMSVSYKPCHFFEITKEYLNSIFSFLWKNKDLPLVFDQMFPADNPLPFMRYLEDARCIVVRRDPRDTYILAKKIYNSSIPIPTESVESFVCFYRKIIYETKIKDTPTILNIQYEDLIYCYDETKAKIEEFLGISCHINPKVKFNPAISANNTQLYKKYKEYTAEIKKIEKSLPDSLYPFDLKPQVNTSGSSVF